MSEAYRSSGVDTEAAAKAVTLIADLAAQARRPEVAGEVGGFAGLFSIGGGRLLAAATDGVAGAEPLFFLDYLAVGRVVPDDVASVVEGIVEGCRLAGCALLGGETAEHPGVMADDRFDLAGFCVGIVDGEQVLGPERVRPGDALIGLPSSGLHANGFSLVRTVVTSDELAIAPPALGRTFADEVLAPCRIYAPEVLALHRDRLVHAAAHITGGGFLENVPRVLPAGLGARIERGAWTEPPIFEEIRRRAAATDADMFGTFNMGIGMVLVVGPDEVGTVLTRAAGSIRIGEVVPGSGVRID
ncbi:MAG: phosphoribosylformylglycinamidine cyclo-ligase [Actinobacteria bacterium]|nr:MAG: phosphoribosylformylglycinamidine cyclo-ligase [Actinomycetota bacterium]